MMVSTIKKWRSKMSQEIIIENTIKAAQGADLLLQDLQGLLSTSDAVMALLIYPEIEKVAGVKQRMEQMAAALKSKE
jgi:hypothetical protein